MYYFRFEIPLMPDGITRATYSKGWHGTMPKCPKGVTVLLYNDKDGYGIARSEDSFVPLEVKELSEKEADAILAEAVDEDGVWFGGKLVLRWNSDYHVGQECICKQIICREYPCSECQIWASHLTDVAEELAKEMFNG